MAVKIHFARAGQPLDAGVPVESGDRLVIVAPNAAIAGHLAPAANALANALDCGLDLRVSVDVGRAPAVVAAPATTQPLEAADAGVHAAIAEAASDH